MFVVLDPELNTDTMKQRNFKAFPTITTNLPFHRHLLFSFFLSLEKQQFSFLFFIGFWVLVDIYHLVSQYNYFFHLWFINTPQIVPLNDYGKLVCILDSLHLHCLRN